jgi:hypothetical protein
VPGQVGGKLETISINQFRSEFTQKNFQGQIQKM